jgi:hypothetical protein
MTVSDPIIELGSNNLNTNDLGIIMTRHGATNSNIALVYDESDDILRMGYTLNGASDSIISLDSNALAVSVQGSLGIGTTSPDLELHVHDANNTNSGIVLSSTSGYHRLYDSGGQLYFQSGTAATADSRADINFTSMYNSTSYMKIQGSNGNVGIGLTSPAFTLDVDGVSRSRGVVVNSSFNNNTARPALTSGSTHPSYEIRSLGGNGNVGSTTSDDGFLRLRAGGGSSTAQVSYIDLSGYSVYSGNDMRRNIVFGTSGTEQMRIKENGNVGIGVSSPSSKLHIDPGTNDTSSPSTTGIYVFNNTGNGDSSIALRVKDSGSGDPYIAFDSYGEAGWSMGMDNSDSNKFKLSYSWSSLSAATKLTVDTTGKVGIGRTDPDYLLDVDGTTRVGNILYVGKNTNDSTAKTIFFGGTVGDNDYNHTVIERRVWGGTGTNEQQELLLFCGNDGETAAGPDRIRLKGANILFDTLSGTQNARTTENTKMTIKANGEIEVSKYVTQADFPIASLSDSRARNITNVILTSSNFYNKTWVNNGNHFNSSNGRFTCPVDGIYRIYFRCSADGGTTGNNVRLRKNGGTINEAYHGGQVVRHSVSSEAVVSCSANDYLEIEVSQLYCMGGTQHKQVTFQLVA